VQRSCAERRSGIYRLTFRNRRILCTDESEEAFILRFPSPFNAARTSTITCRCCWRQQLHNLPRKLIWQAGSKSYGKSRVRLSRITRLADRHEFNEWTVHIKLYGAFEHSFTEADNSVVLPTDTMKNTVYFVARARRRQPSKSMPLSGRLFSEQQRACVEGRYRCGREGLAADGCGRRR